MAIEGDDFPGGGSIGPEFDGAHDAFNRMARAHRRGTGCYLTAEMIQSLELTVVGGLWAQDDPRPGHRPSEIEDGESPSGEN